MLPGNKPDPGCQVAAGGKRLPVTHLSNQGGGDDRANARDLLEPPAFFARTMPGVDVFLDGADLCSKGDILAGKSIEAKPRHCRNAIVFLVRDDLEQFGCTIAALGRDDAELR